MYDYASDAEPGKTVLTKSDIWGNVKNHDGFVKVRMLKLRCILRHCGVCLYTPRCWGLARLAGAGSGESRGSFLRNRPKWGIFDFMRVHRP
jgi:hypothetical protein